MIGREGTERHDLGPGAPPALSDGPIAAAPVSVLEGAERRLAGGRVNGAMDAIQRRGNGLQHLNAATVQPHVTAP